MEAVKLLSVLFAVATMWLSKQTAEISLGLAVQIVPGPQNHQDFTVVQ